MGASKIVSEPSAVDMLGPVANTDEGLHGVVIYGSSAGKDCSERTRLSLVTMAIALDIVPAPEPAAPVAAPDAALLIPREWKSVSHFLAIGTLFLAGRYWETLGTQDVFYL